MHVYLNRRRLRRLRGQMDAFLEGRQQPAMLPLLEGDMGALQDTADRLMQACRTARERQALDSEENLRWLLDVSHQFKTPLAALRLFCEMDPTPHQEEQLQLLTRMERLLSGLLRLEKLRAGGFSFVYEQTDLTALVQEVQLPLELAYPAVTFRLRGEAGCRCDRLWMSEALSNVLKNACEQAKPAEAGTVEVRLWEDNGFSWIQVTDSFGGVPEDVLPLLFKRFYQAPSSKGMGVGLAIVQEVLARHHGTAAAENTGDGLKITLMLPNLAANLTEK